MIKSFFKPALSGLIAVTLLGAAVSLPAEDQKSAPPKPEAPVPPHPARSGKPYGGTIGTVNKTAMTVTVKKKETEKTFLVTSSTKIMKAGKPATLDDAVVGEEAGVFYKENEGGKAEALSLRLGEKPEKPGSEKKKEAAAGEEKKATQ